MLIGMELNDLTDEIDINDKSLEVKPVNDIEEPSKLTKLQWMFLK